MNFICPQNGESERLLKQHLISAFYQKKEITKAYLVQASYDNSKGTNIILCLKLQLKCNEKDIVNFIANIFSRLFNKDQHLDIVFINESQENILKSICPPFFNRSLEIEEPFDFYLKSTEGYRLETPRKCWCIKQLCYEHRDDFVLVNIEPGYIYNDPREGNINLSQFILAGKYVGHPIFPLKTWPIYVYVIRPLIIIYDDTLKLEKDEIQNIAWGELYPSE